MDILNKTQIYYIIDKYNRNEHKKVYTLVINELTKIINDSNLIDEDKIDFGVYLVYRVNGMPPLILYNE